MSAAPGFIARIQAYKDNPLITPFKIIVFLALATIMCASPQASAQTITTTQNLNFGEGVVTDNDAQHVIMLQFDGTLTNDPEFLFVTVPQEGIYQLAGTAPLTAISSVVVTVDQQVLGPGQDFTIDNFDIDAPATTDGSGEATIRIGARLRTSGTSINYTPSALFNGQFTITVNY